MVKFIKKRKPYRVLVTGSRSWKWPSDINRALALVQELNPDRELVLVHGDAVGADTMAKDIAISLGWKIEPPYVPNWNRDGRAAGLLRNQRMVDTNPDICLAFIHNGSNGAMDCLARVKKAGIQYRLLGRQI